MHAVMGIGDWSSPGACMYACMHTAMQARQPRVDGFLSYQTQMHVRQILRIRRFSYQIRMRQAGARAFWNRGLAGRREYGIVYGLFTLYCSGIQCTIK